MLTLLLTIFTLALFCIDTHNPELRLGFLLFIPILFYYKKSIDQRLQKLSLSKKAWMIIKCLVILLVVFRLGHCTYRLLKSNPNMEDIAHVHLRAFDTLFLEHKNPYSEPIDHYSVGAKDYAGLKYPPLGVFFYAPFIALFKEKGIYVGNFLLYFYSRFHSALGLVFFFHRIFIFVLQ